jgi:uncharacterized protein (TIRG00374 family)
LKRNIKNIVFLIVLVLSLIFLYLKRSSLENLKSISALEMIGLSAVSLTGLTIYAFGFSRLLKMFDIELNFKEWFGLTVCNSMFNYYLPAKGGTVVRAFYLQKHHGFGYSYYASLTAVSYLFSLILYSSLGLLALLFNLILENENSPILGVLFLLYFAGSIMIILLARLILKWKKGTGIPKFDVFVAQMREGLSHFSMNRTPVLVFGLCAGVYLLIMAVRLHLCFRFLNVQVSFMEALIIRSLTEFSFLVSLLPGNLGLKEGLIVFSSHLLNIPPEQAILAALVDRVVAMIVIFGFGFIFSRILLDRLDDKQAPHGAR